MSSINGCISGKDKIFDCKLSKEVLKWKPTDVENAIVEIRQYQELGKTEQFNSKIVKEKMPELPEVQAVVDSIKPFFYLQNNRNKKPKFIRAYLQHIR